MISLNTSQLIVHRNVNNIVDTVSGNVTETLNLTKNERSNFTIRFYTDHEDLHF